ncbi:hypothetical protein GCM10023080_068050 [Streptomyces pseudoechinosporeus]
MEELAGEALARLRIGEPGVEPAGDALPETGVNGGRLGFGHTAQANRLPHIPQSSHTPFAVGRIAPRSPLGKLTS